MGGGGKGGKGMRTPPQAPQGGVGCLHPPGDGTVTQAMLGSRRTPPHTLPALGKGCKRRVWGGGDSQHPKGDPQGEGDPLTRPRRGGAPLRPAQLITAAEGLHPTKASLRGAPKIACPTPPPPQLEVQPQPDPVPHARGGGDTTPRKARLGTSRRVPVPPRRVPAPCQARPGGAPALRPAPKNTGGAANGHSSSAGRRGHGGGTRVWGQRGHTPPCQSDGESPSPSSGMGGGAVPSPRASVSPPEHPEGCGEGRGGPRGSAERLVPNRAWSGATRARPDVTGIPTGLITGRL